MGYHEEFFEECREYTGAVAGRSVLVIGCGRGHECRLFNEAGASVTGLDICEDIGSEFSAPGVRYHRAPAEASGLASDQFDVVFSVATMEHVQGVEAAFREMVRLARTDGSIFSFAAPLWNSRRGHHMDCLNPFPWIHLRYGRDEIVAIAEKHGLKHGGVVEVRDMMDFLFVSDYFNRAPSTRYVDACRGLQVSKVLRTDIWLDGEDELTPEILAELQAKGYTREELLSANHRFVAKK